MTTTPAEPVENPQVVPAGDPGHESTPEPETEPSPLPDLPVGSGAA
ncbi:MAG: hypothetical protein JWP74_230 [Marmoricola sp.]|nr:hypothetical protein [Marmoricola sp.]